MCRTDEYDIKNLNGKYIEKRIHSPNYGRHVFPAKNIVCFNCKARMWMDEKTEGSKKNPKFSICCSKGQFKLPDSNPLPPFLFQLLTGNGSLNDHFRQNIRAFNSAFAFTSFNANVKIIYYN